MTAGVDRTLRGAVSGAAAAAVWAAQQPLDKRVFASRYDDVELLGRALVPGGAWYPAGLVLHLGNGALFGAAYATLGPALPVPPAVRGPLTAVVEHVGLWPLVALSDRFHPARERLPRLSGDRRAFLQGSWRHLLFGLVLAALERRLNASASDGSEGPVIDYSSNGHGSLEHAVSVRDRR